MQTLLPPPSSERSNEPVWLPLPANQLGAVFEGNIETNRFVLLEVPAMPQPDMPLPQPTPSESFGEGSSLRVAGSLATRALLSQIELPSWTNTDLLTNTIVQVVVDNRGETVSATTLSGSGYPPADKYALDQARTARFEPLKSAQTQRSPGPLDELSWGQLIFKWQTMAPVD